LIVATEIFCLSEIGKRAKNEDFISPEKGSATSEDSLFIVCDGVGGEKRGEVASQIVCTSIQNYIKNETFPHDEEMQALRKAIAYANDRLAKYVSTDPMAARMSTTLALVFLVHQSVIAAWCGDTRIHHIRNGTVIWKSNDHSLVSELVSRGELTEEDARTHPRRNVITRSLNAINFNNNVDFHRIMDFETGDYLLICTDGLLEKVNEEIIYKILTGETEKDKAKCFLSYCEGKTNDNFSMYLIQGTYVRTERRVNASRTVVIIFILALIVVVIFSLIL
jgi:serine/threonine protein phosphatase PrpC